MVIFFSEEGTSWQPHFIKQSVQRDLEALTINRDGCKLPTFRLQKLPACLIKGDLLRVTVESENQFRDTVFLLLMEEIRLTSW